MKFTCAREVETVQFHLFFLTLFLFSGGFQKKEVFGHHFLNKNNMQLLDQVLFEMLNFKIESIGFQMCRHCSVFLVYGMLFNKLLATCDFFVLQGEDHLERRDSENLHIQMVNGEDHPHPTGTTQIISPLTTTENEREMTEEVKAIGNLKCLLDYTANFTCKNNQN